MALLHKLFHLTQITGEPTGNYLNKVLQVRNEMAELKPKDDNVFKMMITESIPEIFHSRTHYMDDQNLEKTLEESSLGILFHLIVCYGTSSFAPLFCHFLSRLIANSFS